MANEDFEDWVVGKFNWQDSNGTKQYLEVASVAGEVHDDALYAEKVAKAGLATNIEGVYAFELECAASVPSPRRRFTRTRPPPEPEWPIEHCCKLCSAPVYLVIDRDGVEVAIDTSPLSAVVGRDVVGVERVVRASARHELVDGAGGYSLLDPQLFYGLPAANEQTNEHSKRRPFVTRCVGEKVPTPVTEPEWQWFASPVPLADAYARGQAIYSDHILTCSGVDERALIAKMMYGAQNDKRRVSRRVRSGTAAVPVAEPTASEVLSAPTPATVPNRDSIAVSVDRRGQLAMW